MNILTAEEWLSNNKEMSIYDVASYDEGGYCGIDEKALYKIMIEFAKMHVEAALKLVSENAEIIDDPNSYTGNTGSEYPPDQIISEDSILNAYPLILIK